MAVNIELTYGKKLGLPGFSSHQFAVSIRAEVARLYAELWDVPSTEPDAAVLRGHARARGWVPPLAWDDELMGNPSVQPMGVAV